MAYTHREKLMRILEVIESKVTVTPGDVVVETGLPRYEVLAAFHFLEALGVVQLVFQRGSYKVYAPTPYVSILKEALQHENPLEYLAERLRGRSSVGQSAEQSIPEAVGTGEAEVTA